MSKLKGIVADIYKADEYATELGEKAEKVAPKKKVKNQGGGQLAAARLPAYRAENHRVRFN